MSACETDGCAFWDSCSDGGREVIVAAIVFYLLFWDYDSYIPVRPDQDNKPRWICRVALRTLFLLMILHRKLFIF